MAKATPQISSSDLDDVNDLNLDAEPPAASGAVDVSALAGAIVTAVNAAQGPRPIKAAEYLRTRSIHRDKPELTRKVYQNGFLLTRRSLTADAIHMVNKLQPGLYANGQVQVVALRDGNTGMALDIRYTNKTIDDRMAFNSKFPSFEHLLAAILREQQPTA